MSDVTRILSKIESGDQQASEDLLPLVYEELRRLAAARLVSERPDHTLSATALVHEAYVRLVDVDRAQHWDSRGHFFSAAAEAMRRILIDSAKRRSRKKRGGDGARVELDDWLAFYDVEPAFALEVNDLIDTLEKQHPRSAVVAKLRFFVGLHHGEIAESLGLTRRQVDIAWAFAKSWLANQLDFADKTRPQI